MLRDCHVGFGWFWLVPYICFSNYELKVKYANLVKEFTLRYVQCHYVDKKVMEEMQQIIT